jgi:hypothetical protein
VNKLLLQLAEVNGLIKYSATELVLSEVHCYVAHAFWRTTKRRIDSNNPELGCFFFFRSPVDSPLYKISWPFSVVLFVLLGANFLTSPLPYSENELGRLRVECSSFETIREQKVFLSDSRARFLAQIESSMHNIIEINSVGCKSLGT